MSMRFTGRLLGTVAVLALGTGASAADKLAFAPAPDWVRAIATPADVPGDDAAIRMLLLDQQLNFTGKGTAVYVHSVSRIQTPQGLAASNAVNLGWRPDSDVLTVHHVRVIHQGQARELVARPEDFTILRRENNLELATLDGVLTATMQPEGLEVGDTIDIAYTLERHDPVVAGHGEHVLIGGAGVPIRGLHLSALWDKGQPMRWRPIDLSAAPKVTGQQLTLDAADVQPLISPAGAPLRFQLGRLLAFSDFRSWEEVSALFAPLFVKARTLDAASPLKAEIARIRAASNDPVKQAEAALALAQDQVRYVAILLNDGNLVPASADATWQRRFGDCKAKTALLLALLDGLGIQAEPVLANVMLGDGMDERLPSVGAFNHVLVRATIAGKAYWLDGTRMGDTSLARLRVPAFGWMLPLRAKGAALERLMPPPADVPDSRVMVRLDASAGLGVPAKAHVEAVMTGDLALGTSIALSNLTPIARDEAIRGYFRQRYDSITPDKVSASFDKETGEQKLVMDGTAMMDWRIGKTPAGYEMDGMGLGWRTDFTRSDGPHKDAPFAVNYPTYTRTEEEIVLPNGGKGFVFTAGVDEDRIVAGRHFLRTGVIKDGVARIKAETRGLVPEFPAAEAPEAQKALRAMNDVGVYIQSPGDYRATPADEAAIQAEEPKDAAGYVRRGRSRWRQRRWQDAFDDFAQALKLDPNDQPALAGQGDFYMRSGDFAAARKVAERLLAIEPDGRIGLVYAGMAAANLDKPAVALPILDKAITANPGNPNLLNAHAWTKLNLNDDEGALRDCEQVIKSFPAYYPAYGLRADILLRRDDREKVAATGEAVLAANPDDPEALRLAGTMFSMAGRTEDAARTIARWAAMKPDDPTPWVAHSRIWPEDQRDKSIADIEKALSIKPDALGAWMRLAELREETGDYPAAMDAYKKALAVPSEARPFIQIGMARILARMGDNDGAARIFAEVRATERAKTSSAMMNSLCYEAAAAKFALEQALTDCRAAIKLQDNSPSIQDSLAFVLLRMGRYDEAVAAYDEGLGMRFESTSTEANLLYGRGLARVAKGQKTDGEADLVHARNLSRTVERDFRRYGMIP